MVKVPVVIFAKRNKYIVPESFLFRLWLGFTKESEQYRQSQEKVANVKKTRFCIECRTFETKDFAL